MSFFVSLTNRARPWLLLWLLPWLVMGTVAPAPHDHDFRAARAFLCSPNAPLQVPILHEVAILAEHEECLLCEWLAIASALFLGAVVALFVIFGALRRLFLAPVRRAAFAASRRYHSRGPPRFELDFHQFS